MGGGDGHRIEQAMRDALTRRYKVGELRRLLAPSDMALVDFASNDYLGLAAERRTDFRRGLADGSTGSRLLTGNSAAIEELEARISTFHGTEAALLFNSGFDANAGLFATARVGEHGVILFDEYVHASVHDGMRALRRGRTLKFAHNDVADLERKLTECGGTGAVLVAVESVYSMQGTTAPLARIAELCHNYGARLIVDEAHTVGIAGRHGRGLLHRLGLARHPSVLATVVTFGKAFGAQGAAVLGSPLLRDYLINFARPLIYSTALSPRSVHTLHTTYTWMASPEAEHRRFLLSSNVRLFQKFAEVAHLHLVSTSIHPIQAIRVAGAKRCVSVAQHIREERGFLVLPIRRPTVPEGEEQLRVVVHTFNTASEIAALVEAVAGALQNFPPARACM